MLPFRTIAGARNVYKRSAESVAFSRQLGNEKPQSSKLTVRVLPLRGVGERENELRQNESDVDTTQSLQEQLTKKANTKAAQCRSGFAEKPSEYIQFSLRNEDNRQRYALTREEWTFSQQPVTIRKQRLSRELWN